MTKIAHNQMCDVDLNFAWGAWQKKGGFSVKKAVDDPLLPVLFSLARYQYLSSSVSPSWSTESSQIKKDGREDQLVWKFGKIIKLKKLEWGSIFPGLFVWQYKIIQWLIQTDCKIFLPLKCIDS